MAICRWLGAASSGPSASRRTWTYPWSGPRSTCWRALSSSQASSRLLRLTHDARSRCVSKRTNCRLGLRRPVPWRWLWPARAAEEALHWSRRSTREQLPGAGARPDADPLRTAVVIALGLGRQQRAATLAAAAEAIAEALGTPGTGFPILAAGTAKALALTGPEAEHAFDIGRRMSWLEAYRFAAGEESD